MLEPRRSRYLRALGIDVYVPRVILPGARPSTACEWEREAAFDVAGSRAAPTGAAAVAALVGEPAPQAAPAPESVTRPARSLAPELDVPAATAPRRAESTMPPVAKAEASDTAPRIALGIAVGSGILLVDDAPANTGERGELQRLLANILFALRSDGAAPTLDVFVWPMLKQPQLDHGAEAARETLAAHIQNQIERHAVHTVLLLGAAAQQWVQVESTELRCVHSVSALGCLRQPADKRQLWQDIRHLAAVH